MSTTYQKWEKKFEDPLHKAQAYYSLLFTLNGMHLTEREIQLVAFSAIRGNLSNANMREEFCKMYGTSFPTINNMISRLKKMGIVMKEDKKIRLVPQIVIDFNDDVILNVNIK